MKKPNKVSKKKIIKEIAVINDPVDFTQGIEEDLIIPAPSAESKKLLKRHYLKGKKIFVRE